MDPFTIIGAGGRTSNFKTIFEQAGLVLVFALLFFLAKPVQAQYLHEGVLTLRMGDVSANKFPFILAQDHGIWEKNGLNVRPQFSPGSVRTINKSGVEVAPENIYDPNDDSIPETIFISGSGPTIARVMRSPDAEPPFARVMLGTTHHISRWRIFTGPGITSVEQLKGKRLGLSGIGSVSGNYWLNFIEHMGWDPHTDVTFVEGTLGAQALLDGEVDAMMGPELHGTMMLMNDLTVLADFADYGFPVAGSALWADREWYDNNPEAAKAFMKTAVDAIALMKTDRAAADETMIKWYGMRDQEARDLFYIELLKMDSKPYPPYEGVKMIMRHYGSWDTRAKWSPEDFYDDTYIKELDESGYIDSLYPGPGSPR